MDKNNDLIKNIEKIHTTGLGIIRIRRNLKLETNDVVNWCKKKIMYAENTYKKGKNWYVSYENIIFTINANNYTIITAHFNKKSNEKFIERNP